MEFTGEMLIPKENKGTIIFGEHWARYIFASQFAKGKVVLDVACGSGYGARYLAQKGARKVYGVDISEKAIGYAQKEYNHPKVKFLVGDAQDIPLPDHSIDLIVSMETIEHVADYKRCLEEVKRVLAQDGLFILSTPNIETYYEDYHPSRWHFKEFTINEFKKILKKYFSRVKLFYQHDWASSTILGEKAAQKDSILEDDRLQVVKISARSPKKSAYVIGLCSDVSLPTGAVETNVIYGLHGIENLFGRIRKLERRIVRLEGGLKEIYRSKSWRTAMFLRTIAAWILKPFRAFKRK